MEVIASDKPVSVKLSQDGNAKLKAANMLMFNLPAGKETCGRVCPGCYAIKEQTRWPSVVLGRNRRLEASKDESFAAKMSAEINKKKTRPKYFRVHASGDFYSQDYINAWETIAKEHPDIIFYAYTKRKRKFSFAALQQLTNFIVIDSLQYKRLNYGPADQAPEGSYICPDVKGADVSCGVSCTYCMVKTAETAAPYFIEH